MQLIMKLPDSMSKCELNNEKHLTYQ